MDIEGGRKNSKSLSDKNGRKIVQSRDGGSSVKMIAKIF